MKHQTHTNFCLTEVTKNIEDKIDSNVYKLF